MEITRLPIGEQAPEDSDCISVERRADGTFLLNCSALASCGDGETAESVAVIGSKPYASYDEAEEAGLAWAGDQCVDHLFISRLE